MIEHYMSKHGLKKDLIGENCDVYSGKAVSCKLKKASLGIWRDASASSIVVGEKSSLYLYVGSSATNIVVENGGYLAVDGGARCYGVIVKKGGTLFCYSHSFVYGVVLEPGSVFEADDREKVQYREVDKAGDESKILSKAMVLASKVNRAIESEKENINLLRNILNELEELYEPGSKNLKGRSKKS